MSVARLKIWLTKAADGLLDNDTLKRVSARFLVEAANDLGGERVYIPCRAADDSKVMLTALRLYDMGLSFAECQEAVGVTISKSTFYRRKREQLDTEGMRELEIQALRKADITEFVYAFGFTGDSEDERWVKIGFSSNPSNRVKSFIPNTDLVFSDAAIIGIDQAKGFAIMAEREVHKRLAEYRRMGEWFALPGYVDQAMETIEAVATEMFGVPRFIYRG